MQEILEFLTNQGVQLVVAGSCGGVARAIALKVKAWDIATTIILGGILGFFVSPIFEPTIAFLLSKFTVDPDRLPGFSAFATGVGGVALIGYGIDRWQDFLNKQKAQAVDPSAPNPKDGG